MMPDYFTFIRFHDKRMLPFLSLVVLFILGLYWKNSAFSISANESMLIGGILAILLFHFSYELQSYWAYNWGVGRVDINVFENKSNSAIVIFFSRPEIVSLCSVAVFWLIVKGCLSFLSGFYSLLSLFLLSLAYILMVLRILRPIYIKQILAGISCSPRFKNMYQYIGYYLLFIIMLNIFSISPLKYHPDFSLNQGFTSLQLMIAMFILCLIVFVINLIFSLASKRYIFLGKIFLQEIDLLFAQSIPWSFFYVKSFMTRIVWLLIIQACWILSVNMLLNLFNVPMVFEVYFLLCFLPCIGYHFLHLYWRRYNDFLMACDMYLRDEVCKKRAD